MKHATARTPWLTIPLDDYERHMALPSVVPWHRRRIRAWGRWPTCLRCALRRSCKPLRHSRACTARIDRRDSVGR